jgi:hypothetical protein
MQIDEAMICLADNNPSSAEGIVRATREILSQLPSE